MITVEGSGTSGKGSYNCYFKIPEEYRGGRNWGLDKPIDNGDLVVFFMRDKKIVVKAISIPGLLAISRIKKSSLMPLREEVRFRLKIRDGNLLCFVTSDEKNCVELENKYEKWENLNYGSVARGHLNIPDAVLKKLGLGIGDSVYFVKDSSGTKIVKHLGGFKKNEPKIIHKEEIVRFKQKPCVMLYGAQLESLSIGKVAFFFKRIGKRGAIRVFSPSERELWYVIPVIKPERGSMSIPTAISRDHFGLEKEDFVGLFKGEKGGRIRACPRFYSEIGRALVKDYNVQVPAILKEYLRTKKGLNKGSEMSIVECGEDLVLKLNEQIYFEGLPFKNKGKRYRPPSKVVCNFFSIKRISEMGRETFVIQIPEEYKRRGYFEAAEDPRVGDHLIFVKDENGVFLRSLSLRDSISYGKVKGGEPPIVSIHGKNRRIKTGALLEFHGNGKVWISNKHGSWKYLDRRCWNSGRVAIHKNVRDALGVGPGGWIDIIAVKKDGTLVQIRKSEKGKNSTKLIARKRLFDSEREIMGQVSVLIELTPEELEKLSSGEKENFFGLQNGKVLMVRPQGDVITYGVLSDRNQRKIPVPSGVVAYLGAKPEELLHLYRESGRLCIGKIEEIEGEIGRNPICKENKNEFVRIPHAVMDMLHVKEIYDQGRKIYVVFRNGKLYLEESKSKVADK